jgi:hypothetical protein
MAWGTPAKESNLDNAAATFFDNVGNLYIIQLVKQDNFRPLESKRYFIVSHGEHRDAFVEIDEANLIEHNFKKLNS